MTCHENSSANRILVIDDNDSIQEDFCKILIKPCATNNALHEMETALFTSAPPPTAFTPFEVDCASQGEEGLRMARKAHYQKRPYALAFVDGRMPPGWDGIKTIRRLWQECPDLQVVLCTAYADYSWQEIHRALGETSNLLILKKPFDNVEVLQLAHTLTRKWDLARCARGQIENLNDMVRKKTKEQNHIGALLKAALEHSQAGIIIADAENAAIRWINPAAKRILEQEQLIDAENAAIRHDVHQQFFRPDGMPHEPGRCPLFRAMAHDETIQNEEFFICNAKGQKKWISFNAAPVRGPDKITSERIIIFQDITRNKSIEMQLHQARKMEAIGTMAAGISHDFNNMLYIITGNVELAMTEIEEQHPVHTNLKEIKYVALRTVDVVKQLLNFSRNDELHRAPINAVDVIKDVLKFMRASIPASIQIRKSFPDTDVIIHGDATQLNQLMINLCINAFQAMEETGGILDIAVERITLDEKSAALYHNLTPGEWLGVTVTDTGPGIEPDIIDSVFDPYFTTKTVGKGSGMGLAVVKGIVENHHGGISVDSTPGKGTTFRLFFEAVDEKVIPPPTPSSEIPRGNGERILVVDDEQGVVSMVGSMLERLGYVVEGLTDPMDTLERFMLNPDAFDMVLTDMTMPQMTGVRLSQKVKAIRSDIPIILCTGRRSLINEETIKSVDIEAYVSKPIMMNEIGKTIRNVLDKAHVGMQNQLPASGVVHV